jgi:hypothetical protein
MTFAAPGAPISRRVQECVRKLNFPEATAAAFQRRLCGFHANRRPWRAGVPGERPVGTENDHNVLDDLAELGLTDAPRFTTCARS